MDYTFHLAIRILRQKFGCPVILAHLELGHGNLHPIILSHDKGFVRIFVAGICV